MSDTATCYHCSEALPAHAVHLRIDERMQAFCCHGCAGAAQWIQEEGLADYYRLRTDRGEKVDEQALNYASWDRDEIINGHCRRTPEGMEVVLLTDAMHCAACSWLIQKALRKDPGVRTVNANAITGRIDILWDPALSRLSGLCSQLARLGYKPYLSMNEDYERQKRQERNRLLLKLGIAALVTTQTMMFSEALYLDTRQEMPLATRDFFRWLTFLLCTPVVFYSGSEFIRGMLHEIRHRQPGMDTLAASSILLAYSASLYQTIIGGGHVWFDAAAMFVLFLLSARILERFARNTARAKIDLLAKAQPQFAWRTREGRREQCPVSQLDAGDILFLAPGEAIPADGMLLSEAIEVDESLLTGEAELQTRRRGEALFAGSTLGTVSGEMEVKGTGSGTQLSQILRLVQQAQGAKPIENQWSERLASRFVVIMFAVTVLAYLVWWQLDAEKAFPVALAVLVAACPCALSLAVPAAVSSAFDALARGGVLVLSPDALNRLKDIEHVVFDKTGTLTRGQAQLCGIRTFNECSESEARQIAYSMELGSKHPLAKAFHADGQVQIVFDALSAIPGQGIQARLGAADYRLGKAGFVAAEQPDAGIWLSRNQQLLAHFALEDPVKPDAAAVIANLRSQSLQCHLLSGDSLANVQQVADALDLRSYQARVDPAGKMHFLQTLQRGGGKVLMVGDGINDAPVLAQADVSMAMGSGAYVAQSSADILLMNSRLAQVVQVLSVARHMRQLMRQNLHWAIAYNVIAVCIALSGYIHPGYASLGMACSSLLVTLNALRIYRKPP